MVNAAMSSQPRLYRDPPSHSERFVRLIKSTTFPTQMSDALSSEWQKNIHYSLGDRVAFKLGNAPGVAAFECTQPRTYPAKLMSPIVR